MEVIEGGGVHIRHRDREDLLESGVLVVRHADANGVTTLGLVVESCCRLQFISNDVEAAVVLPAIPGNKGEGEDLRLFQIVQRRYLGDRQSSVVDTDIIQRRIGKFFGVATVVGCGQIDRFLSGRVNWVSSRIGRQFPVYEIRVKVSLHVPSRAINHFRTLVD